MYPAFIVGSLLPLMLPTFSSDFIAAGTILVSTSCHLKITKTFCSSCQVFPRLRLCKGSVIFIFLPVKKNLAFVFISIHYYLTSFRLAFYSFETVWMLKV